jgi:EAL domain-containing protein (putative c-di-GMP-specific phosphodiesterase class I)
MRTRLDDVMAKAKTDANLLVSESSLPECSRDTVVAALQLEAEHNLKNALETGQLELFYQPIIALDTLQVVGCESLIRWRHPQRGLVPPVEFIGLAEESGLIIPIGHWIILEAIQACQRFRNKSSHFAFVSINLSGKQFIPGDLVDYIQGIFQQEQIDPKHIKFEITESILMANPLDAAASLEALQALGSTIAIDDFGTGYSSLSYLHRFPIDTLKIDKSFVSTMLENKKSHEIVKSLCILAKALCMSIVAEGIEKVEEHQRMRKMGANYGQGYFYAKPMPESEFCDYLLKHQAQAVVDL